MFEFAKKLGPRQLQELERRHAQRCFAQEGEDLILETLLEGVRQPGFYVDVGAYHPFSLSNTYRFYSRGWSGINIDATPGTKEEFDHHRPRDINVHQPIAEGHRKLSFYMFNEPALNGFSKELSEARHAAANPYHIKQVVEMETAPLSAVLDHYMPAGRAIDFLSVDVEDFDLEVLRSNDWAKYSPTLVLTEATDCRSIVEVMASPIYEFMTGTGYSLVARTPRTSFFQKTPNLSGA
jgi:hypothetical protein